MTINLIKGSGGGGSSKQHTPVEAPNTLTSTTHASTLDLISAGEIEGLSTGNAASILLNDTALGNSDGSMNFKDTAWDIRYGLPSQSYIPGFSSVETEFGINTEVKSGAPVTHTVSANNIDSARVTIRLPSGLYQQNVSNGDTNGYQVQVRIEVKPTVGGTWSTAVTDTINGKTMSVYERAYLVGKPSGLSGATWDIRVSRLSLDDSVATKQSDTFWDRYTEIQEVRLNYNNDALVGFIIDAKSAGGQIPTRKYLVKGIKCQVPVNYDPISRAYTGLWTGAFKTAWTNNPAWVCYDLLTNARYGLGNYIDPASIDKFSFYEAAVCNDQLVSNGAGGYEPRFTYNNQIVTRDPAWSKVQKVASIFNSVIVVFGGIVKCVQDRPYTPSKQITTGDVIDGLFTYSSSGITQRHTACNVIYNDKDNRFQSTTAHYQDDTAVARYGYNLSEITLEGCTSHGQAMRTARWLVDTEINTTELVTFSVGFNHADIEPGMVINILDNNYSQTNFGCKVAGGTTSSLVLDRPVTLKPSVTYKVSVLGSDGVTIRDYNILENGGTFSTVTPATMVEAPIVGYSVIVSSVNDVVARPFRVVSIGEEQPGRYTVGAIQYDANKYARVETGVVVATNPYISFDSHSVGPVSNITFTKQQYSDPTFGSYVNLVINWDAPDDVSIQQYAVRYRKDNKEYSTTHYVSGTQFVIEKAVPGAWDVIVVAYNLRGVASTSVTGTYTFDVSGTNTLYPPTSLVIKAGTGTSAEFYSTDLTFQWSANSANAGSALAGYLVQVYDSNTSTLIYSDRVASNVYEYTYLYSLNQQNSGGPFRNLQIKIYSLDAQGLLSASALTNTFHNYAPPVPNNFTTTALSNSVMLKWDSVSGPDIGGYIVWASTTAGFTQTSSNVIYKGDGTLISHDGLTSGATWYYRIATFDTFGSSLNGTGLTVSSTSSAIPTRAGVPSGSSFPTTPAPVAGDVFYLTTDSHLYQYTSGSWVKVASDIVANTITGAMVQAFTITGNNVAAGTLTADKISVGSLAAISADMGSITAGTITLNTSGFIRGGSTAYNTGSGFFLGYSGSAYKFSVGDSAGPGVSWDGSAFTIRGAGGATILSSGTGITYSGITGIPTSLSAINSSEGSKLSGIAAGATVGATFGSNIGGQINSSNVSTYIAGAAIQTAQIANAAITNALIGTAAIQTANIADANVNTLKIAGNAVTIPVSAFTSRLNSVASGTVVQTIYVGNPDSQYRSATVLCFMEFEDEGLPSVELLVNGSSVLTTSPSISQYYPASPPFVGAFTTYRGPVTLPCIVSLPPGSTTTVQVRVNSGLGSAGDLNNILLSAFLSMR